VLLGAPRVASPIVHFREHVDEHVSARVLRHVAGHCDPCSQVVHVLVLGHVVVLTLVRVPDVVMNVVFALVVVAVVVLAPHAHSVRVTCLVCAVVETGAADVTILVDHNVVHNVHKHEATSLDDDTRKMSKGVVLVIALLNVIVVAVVMAVLAVLAMVVLVVVLAEIMNV